jgi:tetratricopeptide (TPR) repeat protein
MAEVRLHHLKDVRKAIEEFEDALAVDPECQPAIIALFDLYFERGENDKALKLSEKLSDRMLKEGDPQQRSQFFSRRGQILAMEGNLSSAVESLAVALELTPENLEALDWLIALCRRSPDAYDFATVFRDLEKVYRNEENQAAVAHVLVAAGALSEIAGDAETALARYQEAMEEAPQDLAPVKSLADLFVRIRMTDEAVQVLSRLAERAEDTRVKIKALRRLGDIWSNVVMNPKRAKEAYQGVLALDPGNHDVAFRLVQEDVVLGRLDEAYRRMSDILEQSVSDGPLKPRVLSNYTHYMGVILEKMEDFEGAIEHFRHALKLNERNPGAAIALAQRMAAAGEREEAQKILERCIRANTDHSGGEMPILELRRALGCIHLGRGEMRQAVSQLEAVVHKEGRIEDRIALAEVYARERDGIPRATDELWQVLEGDGFNPHVLRLLADLYERLEDQYRTLQVLQVMEMLGWASRAERDQAASLRRIYAYKPVRAIDEGLRQHMVSSSLDPFIQQLWRVIKEPIERLFPLEPELSPEPVSKVQSPDFRQLVERCVHFFGVECSVAVSDDVPGGALADTAGSGKVIVDRLFIDRPFTEVAFVLGRNLEYFRSGNALLSRLAFDDRRLLGELVTGLMQPPDQQNDLAQEFRKGLSRRRLKQLDSLADSYQDHVEGGGELNSPYRWFSSIDRTANQAGLVACDDITAAMRMAAQLSGEELAVGSKGEVAVQLIVDGPELVKYFLSEDYVRLRRKLAQAE